MRPPRLRRDLAACCAPQLLVAADFSLLGVNGPALRADLGLSEAELAWCFSGYSIAFGVMLLPAGRLADRFDRARLLRAGLLVFAVGALAAAFAPGAASLIAARALQGAGAAVTVPAALALLAQRFGPGSSRTAALAAYGTVVSVGFVAGAIAGGAAETIAGWRAGFTLEILFAAAALALIGRPVRARPEPESGCAPTTSVPGLRFALRRPGLPIAGAGAAALTATGTAGIVLLTVGLQEERGLSALETSWLMVAFGLPAPAAGGLARSLVAIAGSRAVLGGGLAAQAVALVLLSAAGIDASLALLVLGLAVFGAGHVVASAGAPMVALEGVAERQQGLVSGLVGTAQFAGAAVGPLFAAAFTSRSGSGLMIGAGICGLVGAATLVAAGSHQAEL